MKKVNPFSKIVVFLLLIGGIQNINAQLYLNYSVNQAAILTADAGLDQIICLGDAVTLGGSPTATGGYGSYAFAWTPSGNLNNSAASNPVATLTQSTNFLLNMTDSLGCQAVDTIEITVDTCVGTLTNSITSFDVYPNPNDGKFMVSIELAAAVANVDLSVIDLNGRTIFSKSLQHFGQSIKEQITLDGISRGTYFIRIHADGKELSRKMILR